MEKFEMLYSVVETVLNDGYELNLMRDERGDYVITMRKEIGDNPVVATAKIDRTEHYLELSMVQTIKEFHKKFVQKYGV